MHVELLKQVLDSQNLLYVSADDAGKSSEAVIEESLRAKAEVDAEYVKISSAASTATARFRSVDAKELK